MVTAIRENISRKALEFLRHTDRFKEYVTQFTIQNVHTMTIANADIVQVAFAI